MKWSMFKLVIIVMLCYGVVMFGIPEPKTDREDKKPELSKMCEKFPVKDLLEGKIPWEQEISGDKCSNKLTQLQARKNAIKNALECARAKLKRFKSDIEKLRGEIESLLNSGAYKEIRALERESLRCEKCTSAMCPRSSDFCGGISPATSTPQVPLLDIGDFGMGGCAMEFDFHQPCIGSGGAGGLRRALRGIKPPKSTTLPPTKTCCDKVYTKCTEKGWTVSVEGCENIPQPQPSKTSIQQKFQEIQLLFLHGRCPDVIKKLPDLINEVKDKAKVPTIPFPTYDELCKDIVVSDAEIEKIEGCKDVTRKCISQCIKKEGEKEKLDTECFEKCMIDFDCGPEEIQKCTKDEDCAKKVCPAPVCTPEKQCQTLIPVCENEQCVCKPKPEEKEVCTEGLKRSCKLMAIPCLPEFCKPCFPELVCSRAVAAGLGR